MICECDSTKFVFDVIYLACAKTRQYVTKDTHQSNAPTRVPILDAGRPVSRRAQPLAKPNPIHAFNGYR